MEHTASTVAVDIAIVFILVLANAFFVALNLRWSRCARPGSTSWLPKETAPRLWFKVPCITWTAILQPPRLVLRWLRYCWVALANRTLEPFLAFLFVWMPEQWWVITRTGLVAGFAYFIMTALHVIIGELMPKSIALQTTRNGLRSGSAGPCPSSRRYSHL